MLIAFEGGEGAGKSTQVARLAEWLVARGHAVETTREPGGTPGAEAIRALFVTGAADRWTAETDALLITAARADHVARRIRPALAAGRLVLVDRFVHSTLAYQGHGRGLDLQMLCRLHDFASHGLWPDLVLWLDLPAAEGLARAQHRKGAADRFEAHDMAFHERVRAGFAALAAHDQRIVRIDASGDAATIAEAIAAAVGQVLGARAQAGLRNGG
ncbi:dTMP kinase [Thermaurantiacus sp.]